MSEFKHTSGPWTVKENHGSDEKNKFHSIHGPDGDRIASTWIGPHIGNANLIAASPDLLTELEAAHRIIVNALNIMTDEQKSQWSDLNERDGVKDGMAVTREHTRRSNIAKARGEKP